MTAAEKRVLEAARIWAGQGRRDRWSTKPSLALWDAVDALEEEWLQTVVRAHASTLEAEDIIELEGSASPRLKALAAAAVALRDARTDAEFRDRAIDGGEETGL